MHAYLLLSLIVIAAANQMPSTAFSSTQVTITPDNALVFFNNAPLNYRFQFSLESPPSGVTRIFSALAGYSVNTNTSYDFFTNVIFSGTSLVVLQFNSFGSLTVYRMTFCIIATTPSIYPYLDVQQYLITPQYISDASYTSISGQNSETFTLYTSIFFNGSVPYLIPYISYLKNYNPSTTGIGFIQTNANFGTNSFNLKIIVDFAGILSYIKTTIIILDLDKAHPMNKVYFIGFTSTIHNYYTYPQSFLATQVTPTFFPSIFGPNFSRNCTFAIHLFGHINNNKNKTIMFDYSTNQGFTIQEGGDGLIVFHTGFCLAECLTNGFYNATSNNCQTCSNYMSNCQSCTNSTNCLSCGINGFFDSLHLQCRCRGVWIDGGCTDISYCVKIDPLTGICLACSNNFTLSANGSSCDCLTGNLGMSGICISLSGCMTAAVVHSKVQCVACNTSANFRISLNYTCNCESGLTLVDALCVPVCGDGKVYLNEGCDDGNTFDGDGCSSACIIEQYYACRNGSTTHQSDCYYANRNIKLTLTSTYKETKKGNFGMFIFTFTPAPSILSKVDFSSSAVFSSSPRHQVSSISYAKSQLSIQVSYIQDLEERQGSLSVKLDKNIILNNEFTSNFTIRSSNYPLIVFSYYDQLISLELTMQILIAITLPLFILGSWAHKMIGVQTIYSFLFVYLSLSIDGVGNNQIFSPLKKLRYLANYGDIFQEPLSGINSIVKTLYLRQKFIENNFIIIFLLFLGVLAPILMTLCNQMRKPSKRCNQVNGSNYSFFSIFFKVVLFPLVVGYLSYTFITAILSILADNTSSFPFDTIFMLQSLGFSSIIISLACLNNNKSEVRPRQCLYFIIFITHSFLFVVLLVSTWKNGSLTYLLVASSLCYLTYLIIYPPYKQGIHMLGILFNQLTLTAWFGIVVAIKTGKISEDNKYSIFCAIILLMIVMDILSGIRIIYHLYYHGSQVGQFRKGLQSSLPIIKDIEKRQQMERSQHFNINQIQQTQGMHFNQQRDFPLQDNILGKNYTIASSKILSQQLYKDNQTIRKLTKLMQMKALLRQNLLNHQIQDIECE